MPPRSNGFPRAPMFHTSHHFPPLWYYYNISLPENQERMEEFTFCLHPEAQGVGGGRRGSLGGRSPAGRGYHPYERPAGGRARRYVQLMLLPPYPPQPPSPREGNAGLRYPAPRRGSNATAGCSAERPAHLISLFALFDPCQVEVRATNADIPIKLPEKFWGVWGTLSRVPQRFSSHPSLPRSLPLPQSKEQRLQSLGVEREEGVEVVAGIGDGRVGQEEGKDTEATEGEAPDV